MLVAKWIMSKLGPMDDLVLELAEDIKLASGNIVLATNHDPDWSAYKKGSEHKIELDGKEATVKLLKIIYTTWGYHESSLSTFEEHLWEAEIISST